MSQFENQQKATALKYSQDGLSNAPIIVASGSGYTAQKIIDIALENKVPVYHDDSLSSLLSQLEIGSEIPTELYQAIIDIYIYFLNFTVDDTQEEKTLF